MNDTQTEIDAAREARIADYARQLVTSLDYADRKRLWRLMSAEIGKRSLQQIARMEQQQGLR